MKIVFSDQFYSSGYANDPAAEAGRLEGIMALLSKNSSYGIVPPEPASKEDICRAHSARHFSYVRNRSFLYEISALAAGASIAAAELAYDGEPSFAVVRPPGHHASADSCWGFCYFNNISISLLKLFSEKKIASAFVLDFDLHTGDGNINILVNRSDGFRVDILNPAAGERKRYLEEVEDYMEGLHGIDIFAASAGFDQGIGDWGNLLKPDDYTVLGRLMKSYSEKLCSGRRFALLEGGYNHKAMAINAEAFCKGFA